MTSMSSKNYLNFISDISYFIKNYSNQKQHYDSLGTVFGINSCQIDKILLKSPGNFFEGCIE